MPADLLPYVWESRTDWGGVWRRRNGWFGGRRVVGHVDCIL